MRRELQAELMDDPQLDVREHVRALRGLARINWLSGSARILWPEIRRVARASQKEPIKILDLACGGGDVLCQLYRNAKQAGLSLELQGWDSSPVAIEVARKRAAAMGCSVEFHVHDVIQEALPTDCDLITASLFLHHLNEVTAVELLRKMAMATRQGLIIHDLRRSRIGYCLACVAPPLLTRSRVVHIDGPRSVEGAYTIAEVRTLASRAGLQNVRVTPHWPQRYRLSWETKHA